VAPKGKSNTPPKGICECLGLLVEYAREQVEYPVQRESEYEYLGKQNTENSMETQSSGNSGNGRKKRIKTLKNRLEQIKTQVSALTEFDARKQKYKQISQEIAFSPKGTRSAVSKICFIFESRRRKDLV